MDFAPEFTIPKMLQKASVDFAAYNCQNKRLPNGDFEPVLYREMFQISLDFGAGLMEMGVKREDKIGLISDNRAEWLQADVGLMGIGAIDVPRGCDATLSDLEKILSITETEIVIAENGAQVNKIVSIKDKLPSLKTIICFEDSVKEEFMEACKSSGVKLTFFSAVCKSGKKYRADNPGAVEAEVEKGHGDDLATIIFTSGTTGTPKGVMLTHHNFLAQLDELQERIFLNPGDVALNVLPVWHVFERECEYVITIQGGTISYSKPVGSILLADFKKLNPHLIPAVPRVFEAIYDGITKKMRKAGGIVNKLFNFFVNVSIIHKRMQRKMFGQNACFTSQKKGLWWVLFFIPWTLMWPLYWLGDLLVLRKLKALLGTNFRAGIAGGGAFPKKIDEFFWAIGIKIVEGYGLTETAPVVAVRPIAAPVFRTIGSAIRGVRVRVVDLEGYVLPRGKEGILQVKGETVMKGYYKAPELTAKTMTVDGWLNTGDLAVMTIHDEIQIKGRIKDTIVLRGGENIEPLPIEMKLSESRFIKQAVVVGQDKRYLGALILVDSEEVKGFAAENGLQFDTYENLLKSEEIQKLYDNEIQNLVNSKTGFKMFERVNKFVLITKEFEVGVELSAKQEIMRFRLNELYKNEIASMFVEED